MNRSRRINASGFGLRAVLAFGLAAIGSSAPAAEVSASSAVARHLVQLERESWRLYKAKDEAGLRRIAPRDFADLYLDGSVVGRERWLADMKTVDVLGSQLKDFHVFLVGSNTYLLTYEARARGRTAKEVIETHVGVTSVWTRRDGRWRNTFYEENALEPVRRRPVERQP